MTTRPYELLARFGNDGNVAGVSVRTITTINGKDYESEPNPLSGASDPAFVAFASQFAASVVTERDKLTTDLATKTTAYDAEVAKVTALEAEKATLTSDLATANATIATLTAKVTELEQYRPFNPRILKGEAFYNRVSEEDRNTLIASDIPELQLVGRTIILYQLNKWPVILDSTEFQTLIGYVQASGVFDQAEVDAVMIDARREEAYGT